jgi:DNA-binding MarR family transcriptional regulator
MKQKPASDYFRSLSEWDKQQMLDVDNFIADASLEEKLMLLSRLGYPFALVVGTPQKIPTKPMIQRLMTLFFTALSWKRHDAIRVMRERYFFALADMDVVKGLKLMSNVYNSPAGATLAGYGEVVQKMFTYKHDAQKQHVRDNAAGHDIDSVVLSAMNLAILDSSQASFLNIYGVTGRQYMILAILSRKRECTVGDLNKLTGGVRWITQHIMILLKSRMVEKKIIQEGPKHDTYYWITGLGEQTLIKARNYFLQHI